MYRVQTPRTPGPVAHFPPGGGAGPHLSFETTDFVPLHPEADLAM